MTSHALRGPFQWSVVVPIVAVLVLAATWVHHEHWAVLSLIGAALVGAVLAAVHHAEVVAHKVGEPFGSLILAVAVTVIEVGLIVMLMTSGGEGTSTYARDTVFAAVMITLNGIVGISLLVGAVKHHLVSFNSSGTGTALTTVIALASLTMVLPSFTTSGQGLEFSSAQLTFAAVASLVLYGGFVFTQTVRHRDFFVPVTSDEYGLFTGLVDEDGDDHADPPSGRETALSLVLLVVALVSVVGLAKLLSPTIEDAVSAVGAPYAVVGVVIALLVLAPESIAAVRNASRDRVQVSLNLGFGSAMASIGLTVPTIAVASIWLDGPLELGLETTQLVLLAITVVVSTLTVAQGRAKSQQGLIHLVLFGAFLFLSVVP
ncbi:calcium:proton antiporter [Nocardioides marmotae]|uniref:Ionic transporter y4hA n=1 Tax=Nocardioides marmotae TaxID=2663857 RepID=A0A6I3JGE0_9ACTN|nr:ionic transporter y4hA [Nocardioides marmotae]MCR6033447.1 ionic transporter y4hA [Gordonia jinghuaiqii]MBC9734684.1 ionic transporter y4hA [Nocardioides marmotae]MTB85786.1 ionic transporter y4hA [Nocardioides marmotae]MTB97105.1 ionic transporter y4hA [Nocardioides marmotae]QKE00761.1 ionic transporter y4hA [Nocardioides marmotae]